MLSLTPYPIPWSPCSPGAARCGLAWVKGISFAKGPSPQGRGEGGAGAGLHGAHTRFRHRRFLGSDQELSRTRRFAWVADFADLVLPFPQKS